MFPSLNRLKSRRRRRPIAAIFVTAGLLLGTFAAVAQPAPPPPGGPAPGPPLPANPLMTTQQDAGAAVQGAYDAIGRSTLMAGSNNAEGAANLLIQSKSAYQQALTWYQASNFVAAREAAMIATDLARATDELTSAHLMATTQPGIPLPPQSFAGPDPVARVYGDLGRLTQHRADVAAQIAASPDAVDAEVHRLLQESTRFQQKAQNLLNSQKPEQAGAMARAADALLAACDHSMERALIASGRVGAPAATPPPQALGGLPPGVSGPPASTASVTSADPPLPQL